MSLRTIRGSMSSAAALPAHAVFAEGATRCLVFGMFRAKRDRENVVALNVTFHSINSQTCQLHRKWSGCLSIGGGLIHTVHDEYFNGYGPFLEVQTRLHVQRL